MYELLNEEPAGLQTFRSDIPDNLLKLTCELIEKDINKRIGSTNLVIEELKKKPAPKDKSKKGKSIAVLYFENMSPDEENDYFCSGISEDIITDLSMLQILKVIPLIDVLPFKGKVVSSKKIGETLKVNYILEGSVRKSGQKIRITAKLIDVVTGFQLWAERYDRLLEDIFDIQIEVAEKIADSLKISLTDSQRESLAVKPTSDIRAYDFYARGRDLIARRGKKYTDAGIKMFEHAIAIDPSFAPAYVGLAEAYSHQYWWFDGDQKWLGKVIEMNEQALEIDPNLIDAQFGIGMVYYHQKQFVKAIESFQKVIKERSEFYPAYRYSGVSYEILNKFNEAKVQYEKIAELKPYSEEPWMHLEMLHRKMGNNDKAKEMAEKLIDVSLNKLKINPDDVIVLSRLATEYANLNMKEEALTLLQKVLSIDPDDGLALYNAACTYALLNMPDEAIRLLKSVFQKGFNNLLEFVKGDPDFELIKDEPEFKELIK
jgi:adenylate cyclase